MLAMQRYLPGQSKAARATALWGLILPAVAAATVAVVVFPLAAPERWRVQLALCAGLLLAIAPVFRNLDVYGFDGKKAVSRLQTLTLMSARGPLPAPA
jgi:hypothetical protein